jgi:hypothetical protein
VHLQYVLGDNLGEARRASRALGDVLKEAGSPTEALEDVLGEAGGQPGVSGDVPVEAVDSRGLFVGVPGILECVPNLEYQQILLTRLWMHLYIVAKNVLEVYCMCTYPDEWTMNQEQQEMYLESRNKILKSQDL